MSAESVPREPKCMVLDFAHGVAPIEQPDSCFETAREWRCARCGHSFSESHPTRMGNVCAFDRETP